jgi:hypothetical protein
MLDVGSIVVTRSRFLSNPIGTRGVCFADQMGVKGHTFGLIFANGLFDFLSHEEVGEFLLPIGFASSLAYFRWIDEEHLRTAFHDGLFSDALTPLPSSRLPSPAPNLSASFLSPFP